jgi:hypothetical protein
MRKLQSLTIVFATLATMSSAQTITTRTFGLEANAFSIDFVTIGNPNNPADTTGTPIPAGSVSYTYNLSKYEISREMIDKANAGGGLGITLADLSTMGGNGTLRPASGLSWYEAAKFVNYLNVSSGSNAAYKFDSNGNFQLWSVNDLGYDSNNLYRNSLATFWLPSTDEWYKGAYSSVSGAWSNSLSGRYGLGISSGPVDTTDAGGQTAWGTIGQGGNVWEWLETASDGSNNSTTELRDQRGGSWFSQANAVNSSVRVEQNPFVEGEYNTGFRVASVPEPSSISLLGLGVVIVAIRRRR